MDKITHALTFARLWLETNIGDGAAFGVFCIGVFFTIYLFRKLFPNAWIWLVKRIPYIDFETTPILALLDKTVQALPATLFGLVMATLSSGGSVKVALLGALAGPINVIAHHILQAIPWIPYQGKLGKKAKRRFTPPEGTDLTKDES